MSTLAVILLVLGALLVVLFAGGLVAAGRRARSLEESLGKRIAAANEALASAHAQDRGWERETLEATAREEFARAYPGQQIDELHLIQVIDRPGTDADEAVFRVLTGGEADTLTLGRREGAWVALP